MHAHLNHSPSLEYTCSLPVCNVVTFSCASDNVRRSWALKLQHLLWHTHKHIESDLLGKTVDLLIVLAEGYDRSKIMWLQNMYALTFLFAIFNKASIAVHHRTHHKLHYLVTAQGEIKLTIEMYTHTRSGWSTSCTLSMDSQIAKAVQALVSAIVGTKAPGGIMYVHIQ